MERVEQSCALGETRDRLERCEQERRESDRLLRELRESTPSLASPKAGRKSRDDLASDLQKQLTECEANNTRLQQACAELRTSLGEEIANVEESKRQVFAKYP